jgi:NMD protein affecting ribosome stability and mRNA decay
LDWRYPDRRFDRQVPDEPGILICPACHAVSVEKRWFVDEAKYAELQNRSDVRHTLCPGCWRIARRIYEGDVLLRSPLLVEHKADVLNLIYNEEERARADNPLSRLAYIDDRGDEISILTTTEFLAERIGKAFQKAYDGELSIQHLPRERFCRVRWIREEGSRKG